MRVMDRADRTQDGGFGVNPGRRIPWGWLVLALSTFIVGLVIRSPKTVIVTGGTGPCPRSVVAGVPVGYAQTRDCALSAASNYTEALSGPLVLAPDARDAMVRQVVAVDQQGSQLADLEKAAAAIPAGFGTGAVRYTTPVAGHVAEYSKDRAVVQVWRVAVLAGPAQEDPRESWGIETVELRWEGGDWKFVRQTTTDGPTPLQNPESVVSTARDLMRTTEGWMTFSHAPIPR
jgi:hypothetical protein